MAAILAVAAMAGLLLYVLAGLGAAGLGVALWAVVGMVSGPKEDGGAGGKGKQGEQAILSSSRVEKSVKQNDSKSLLVPEVISKPIAEKVQRMPVWELLSVLGLKKAQWLITRSGPYGLTRHRIRVPKLIDKHKAPEGLNILPYELFDTTEFELLYNKEGYLIAIYPVLPDGFLNKPDERRPQYLDFSEYYFEIPKFGDPEAVLKWDALVRDINASRIAINAYEASVGISGKLERLPRWTPYLYAHIDHRDNFPFVEAFYTEKFGLKVERKEILNEASRDMDQAILPVFPTVYHPGSHAIDDWEYILAVVRRLDIQKDHDVLVVGPGNGLDTWFVSRKTRRKIYVAGINPFEVANTRAVAKIAGFELEAKIHDNIISEDGVLVFNKKFDWVLWNMPTYYPAVPRIRGSLEEWEDGDYGGMILKRCAKGLPLLLKPDGFVLLWNSADGGGLDAVERILRVGGKLDVSVEKYPGCTHLANIEQGTEPVPTALYFVRKAKGLDAERDVSGSSKGSVSCTMLPILAGLDVAGLSEKAGNLGGLGDLGIQLSEYFTRLNLPPPVWLGIAIAAVFSFLTLRFTFYKNSSSPAKSFSQHHRDKKYFTITADNIAMLELRGVPLYMDRGLRRVKDSGFDPDIAVFIATEALPLEVAYEKLREKWGLKKPEVIVLDVHTSNNLFIPWTEQIRDEADKEIKRQLGENCGILKGKNILIIDATCLKGHTLRATKKAMEGLGSKNVKTFALITWFDDIDNLPDYIPDFVCAAVNTYPMLDWSNQIKTEESLLKWKALLGLEVGRLDAVGINRWFKTHSNSKGVPLERFLKQIKEGIVKIIDRVKEIISKLGSLDRSQETSRLGNVIGTHQAFASNI